MLYNIIPPLSIYDTLQIGIVKPALKLGYALLVCCSILGLMSCKCIGGQMTATSNHQTQQRKATAPPTTTAGQSEDDAAKSDNNTSPCRDVLEGLKSLLSDIHVQLAIMALADFSIGYEVDKWRATLKPNRYSASRCSFYPFSCFRHCFAQILKSRAIWPGVFQNPFVAAEQRPIVARGETVDFRPPSIQSPELGERNSSAPVCAAPTGACCGCRMNPRFHRGLLCCAPPALAQMV